MTEHGHNFIREIAEAYRALEAEPTLKETINKLEAECENYFKTVQRLELLAIDRKSEIEALNTKLRSVEAERDEAGFRHLEAEDKVATLVRTFQTVHATVGQTVAHATGSGKDISVMISAAEQDEWEEHKAEQARRVRLAEQEAQWAAEEAARPKPEAVVDFPVAHTESPPVEGQSDTPPTQAPISALSEGSMEASGGTGQSQESGAPAPEPIHGKYFGKRYHDWNYYVPLASWLEGGGTEEDYNWRPASINISRGY